MVGHRVHTNEASIAYPKSSVGDMEVNRVGVSGL